MSKAVRILENPKLKARDVERARIQNNTLHYKKGDLKGCIVAGEKDPRYKNTRIVHEFLSKKGVPTQFYSYPDLSHSVPDDFDQTLIESVMFILGEQNCVGICT